MALGCNVVRLVQVAIPQQERLLRELLALSCSCNCPFTATTAAKCFAGLVNKHPEGKGGWAGCCGSLPAAGRGMAQPGPSMSPGQQLDEILQLGVNRMEPGLAQGPCRMQALTLLLWVRATLGVRGAEPGGPGLVLTLLCLHR